MQRLEEQLAASAQNKAIFSREPHRLSAMPSPSAAAPSLRPSLLAQLKGNRTPAVPKWLSSIYQARSRILCAETDPRGCCWMGCSHCRAMLAYRSAVLLVMHLDSNHTSCDSRLTHIIRRMTFDTLQAGLHSSKTGLSAIYLLASTATADTGIDQLYMICKYPSHVCIVAMYMLMLQSSPFN